MAILTQNLNCIKSVLVDRAKPNQSEVQTTKYVVPAVVVPEKEKRIILAFDAFPSNLKYNVISTLSLQAYVKDRNESTWSKARINIRTTELFPKSFIPTQTTWEKAFSGALSDAWQETGTNNFDNEDFALTDFSVTNAGIQNAILHPIALCQSFSANGYEIDLTRPPILQVKYDSAREKLTTVSLLNGTGYIDRKKAYTFRWQNAWNKYDSRVAVGPVGQTSFEFSWSTDKGNTWTTRTVVSSAQEYTVQANTFPAGQDSVRWKVKAYDGAHEIGEGGWLSFSTADAETSATPIQPADVLINNAEDIIFSWETKNRYGNSATSSELQYSTDGVNWQTFASVPGPSTSFLAAASVLPVGVCLWRVRSFNLDNVAGAWSSPAQFILIGAPTIDGVNVVPVPFASIAWQATGQQAYEVIVDGESQGILFGEGQSFTCESYLEDGEHTIGVRVQNTFGLWSETEERMFTVTNMPGTEITLRAGFDRDAQLSWETASGQPKFAVYRDGERIAATEETSYTDILALGEHSYYVINVLPDGYYTKSNVVTGTMSTEVTLIGAAQNHAGWLELRLTANDPDEQIFSYQRTGSLRHFTGAKLPVLELSKFVDGSGTYDVAFTDEEDIRAFEALKGQVVIIKSRGGNVVVGPMLQLQKRVGDFFTVFDFTVQRIDWEGLRDV